MFKLHVSKNYIYFSIYSLAPIWIDRKLFAVLLWGPPSLSKTTPDASDLAKYVRIWRRKQTLLTNLKSDPSSISFVNHQENLSRTNHKRKNFALFEPSPSKSTDNNPVLHRKVPRPLKFKNQSQELWNREKHIQLPNRFHSLTPII